MFSHTLQELLEEPSEEDSNSGGGDQGSLTSFRAWSTAVQSDEKEGSEDLGSLKSRSDLWKFDSRSVSFDIGGTILIRRVEQE